MMSFAVQKPFTKDDLKKSDIKSVGFDIDIEILTILIQIYRTPKSNSFKL